MNAAQTLKNLLPTYICDKFNPYSPKGVLRCGECKACKITAALDSLLGLPVTDGVWEAQENEKAALALLERYQQASDADGVTEALDRLDEAVANGMKSFPLDLADQIARAYRATAGKQDDADLQLIDERDAANDWIQRIHIALGGDGEWVAKLPPELPPHSGNLAADCIAMAEDLRTRSRYG